MIAVAGQVKTATVMAERPPLPLSGQVAGAIDWWREAGLDCDFVDDATDWLAPPEEAEAPAAPAIDTRAAEPPRELVPSVEPARRVDVDKSSWPTDLAAFRDWWLATDALDTGGAFPRVPPAGPAKAGLMIVVNQPEEGDRDTLLSGPDGALLQGFMRAAQIAPETVYLASLLPRHDTAPDWDAIRAAGLGELLAHHIGLVAPGRILFLGRNIPPLLGHDMAQGPAILRNINHKDASIPAMGAGGLADMRRSARRRERFWRCWLDWTYGET
ncbi:hypothetical protein AM2010_1353 [Pelagerythrobacter marensis]|uniref:Uracil-DNA glycosylase-like domain-containing protein n=2 Tax=Pelagerythrobacter marensis TaxID=543877 RepID=A0A0G3X9W7_9SPHN|nr:hypothetical protein AM2010_1353 [Pelagerythrobacter marensis]